MNATSKVCIALPEIQNVVPASIRILKSNLYFIETVMMFAFCVHSKEKKQQTKLLENTKLKIVLSLIKIYIRFVNVISSYNMLLTKTNATILEWSMLVTNLVSI